MIILPGEKGRFYAYDTETNDKIFYEPEIVIGKKVSCIVKNATPVFLDLQITHIDGEKVAIEYKATHKPQFVNQDIDSKFLDEEFKRGDVFEGIIESMNDHYGVLISRSL